MICTNFILKALPKIEGSKTTYRLSAYIPFESIRHIICFIPLESKGFMATVPTKFRNKINMKHTNNIVDTLTAPAAPEKSEPQVNKLFQTNFAGIKDKVMPQCSEDHILSLLYGCLS